MSNNEQADLTHRLYASKHSALRNALYHTARRRWFEGCSRFLNFLVIVAGTSAATDLLGYFPDASKPAAFSVAVIGALQLVYDFGGRARTHEILQRRFFNLLADIDECEDCDVSTVKKFEAEHSRIAGDEPPRMRALDAIADNQATSAWHGGGSRIRVNWWQSITRHVIAHNGGEFPINPKWSADQ